MAEAIASAQPPRVISSLHGLLLLSQRFELYVVPDLDGRSRGQTVSCLFEHELRWCGGFSLGVAGLSSDLIEVALQTLIVRFTGITFVAKSDFRSDAFDFLVCATASPTDLVLMLSDLRGCMQA